MGNAGLGRAEAGLGARSTENPRLDFGGASVVRDFAERSELESQHPCDFILKHRFKGR
jgi:hypothetical protein